MSKMSLVPDIHIINEMICVVASTEEAWIFAGFHRSTNVCIVKLSLLFLPQRTMTHQQLDPLVTTSTFVLLVNNTGMHIELT